MRARLEWWHYVAIAFLFLQITLFLIPQTRPGEFGRICWLLGANRLIWRGIAFLFLLCVVGWSAWHRPLWNWWRLAGVAIISLLAISPFVFRVYPSSYDDRPSEIHFRVPMDGAIYVSSGGTTPDKNHHVDSPAERWAYDLLVIKDGEGPRDDGVELEDHYSYGKPVLAPVDGVVQATYIGALDMPVHMLGGTPECGNHINIEVAKNQFLFLCHLKPGSILVKMGDRITQGQIIARIGNSGNTSGPHLHIHLQNTPDIFEGEGIPLYFHNYRVGDKIVERGIPMGFHGQRGEWSGQIIKHEQVCGSGLAITHFSL